MQSRRTIFVILMAATFFGPLACCCAWSRVLTVVPAAKPADVTANVPPSDDDETEACPSCRLAKQGKPAPMPVREHHDSPTPKCPCCEAKSLDSQISQQDAVSFHFDQVIHGLLPVTDDEPLVCRGNPRSRVFHNPFDDRQSFLTDFCHRLRC